MLDWKDKLKDTYSGDAEFEELQKKSTEEAVQKSLEMEKQTLLVMKDRKRRKGKTVTLITGFDCEEFKIKDLAKELKSLCGVGGTAKDGEVMIQGDFIDKIIKVLKEKGHKVKKSGGN